MKLAWWFDIIYIFQDDASVQDVDAMVEAGIWEESWQYEHKGNIEYIVIRFPEQEYILSSQWMDTVAQLPSKQWNSLLLEDRVKMQKSAEVPIANFHYCDSINGTVFGLHITAINTDSIVERVVVTENFELLISSEGIIIGWVLYHATAYIVSDRKEFILTPQEEDITLIPLIREYWGIVRSNDYPQGTTDALQRLAQQFSKHTPHTPAAKIYYTEIQHVLRYN